MVFIFVLRLIVVAVLIQAASHFEMGSPWEVLSAYSHLLLCKQASQRMEVEQMYHPCQRMRVVCMFESFFYIPILPSSQSLWEHCCRVKSRNKKTCGCVHCAWTPLKIFLPDLSIVFSLIFTKSLSNWDSVAFCVMSPYTLCRFSKLPSFTPSADILDVVSLGFFLSSIVSSSSEIIHSGFSSGPVAVCYNT